MSIELKIKSKHLALEPAIIRKEEYRILKQIAWTKKKYQVNDVYGDVLYPLYSKYFSLSNHRKCDVRNEARATHLTRAFLRGLPYKCVESKVHDLVILRVVIAPRIVSMVAKYSDRPLKKMWDREKKKMVYDQEELNTLTLIIKKWLDLE